MRSRIAIILVRILAESSCMIFNPGFFSDTFGLFCVFNILFYRLSNRSNEDIGIRLKSTSRAFNMVGCINHDCALGIKSSNSNVEILTHIGQIY